MPENEGLEARTADLTMKLEKFEREFLPQIQELAGQFEAAHGSQYDKPNLIRLQKMVKELGKLITLDNVTLLLRKLQPEESHVPLMDAWNAFLVGAKKVEMFRLPDRIGERRGQHFVQSHVAFKEGLAGLQPTLDILFEIIKKLSH